MHNLQSQIKNLGQLIGPTERGATLSFCVLHWWFRIRIRWLKQEIWKNKLNRNVVSSHVDQEHFSYLEADPCASEHPKPPNKHSCCTYQ